MSFKTESERFWEKVVFTDTCWLWTAAKTNKGYGIFIDKFREKVYSHRWLWEKVYGFIKAGNELHHNLTCPKNCVNYDHIKSITNKLHNLIEPRCVRKDNKCRNGHEMTEINTYTIYGRAFCKECGRKRALRYYYRKKVK